MVGRPVSTVSAHPDRLDATSPVARTAAPSRRRVAPAPVAASYARYSSDLQDESSNEQQQRKCRERATADGYAIPVDLEFADHAVSGTVRDRDGLNAMMAAAEAGRFAVLYLDSLSRLARESVITMPLLKELVHVHRVRVVSVADGIDTNMANWEVLASLMAWMHEGYLKALRAAVLRGQEEAVLKDWSVGDWCFGYAAEPIPGSEAGRKGRHPRPRMRVVIDGEHAKWVRQVFAWFVEDGWSIDRIAKELGRRNAPKHRRGPAGGWHREAVRRLLRNEKYIGVWVWGKRTNVRDPFSGDIFREARPAEEVAKYTRVRDHLRLIDDATFCRAAAKLDAATERVRAVRQPDGRLRGSTRDLANPRHLLQGLLHCGACGKTFQVCSGVGRYLGCAGYKNGACEQRGRVARDRAEAVVLAAVGERLLDNPAWRTAVLAEATAAWQARVAAVPADRERIDRDLAKVTARIARLVDQIEDADDPSDLQQRLTERLRERVGLRRELAQLPPADTVPADPPTAAWVDAKLADLRAVLARRDPEAAVALRNLIGRVKVTAAARAGYKRVEMFGTFDITGAGRAAVGAAAPAEAGIAETVTVSFAGPPPWAAVADRVKELFDAGMTFEAIAAEVGCIRSWATKGLAYWHRQRGLTPPDGRQVRDRLPPAPTKVDEIIDAAKALWDQGLPQQEIAARLGRRRDEVMLAIARWHESRGLPVPDGRHRRKQLRLAARGNDAINDGDDGPTTTSP